MSFLKVEEKKRSTLKAKAIQSDLAYGQISKFFIRNLTREDGQSPRTSGGGGGGEGGNS